MSSAFPKISTELLRELDVDNLLERRLREDAVETRVRRIARAGNLWAHRKLLGKFAAWGGGIALLIAFLIPSRFTSTTQLMPPDPPQGQGLAALVSLTGKVGGNLGSLGSELLGMKTSADLFAGVLLSRTVQEDLINKFDLRKVYRERRWVDARKELTRQTDINSLFKLRIVSRDVREPWPRSMSRS
jgi:tyrosine-protein kinase Etk/Wzc